MRTASMSAEEAEVEDRFTQVAAFYLALNTLAFAVASCLYYSRRTFYPISNTLPLQVFAIVGIIWLWTLFGALMDLLRYAFPCYVVSDVISWALIAAYIGRALSLYLKYAHSVALAKKSSRISQSPLAHQADFGALGETSVDAPGNPLVRLYRLLTPPQKNQAQEHPSSSELKWTMTDEEITMFLAPNNQMIITWGPSVLLFTLWAILCLVPTLIFIILLYVPLPNEIYYYPQCSSVNPDLDFISLAQGYYAIGVYVIGIGSIPVVGFRYMSRLEEGLGIKQEMWLCLAIGTVLFGFFSAAFGFGVSDYFIFEYPTQRIVTFSCHFFFIVVLEVMPIVQSFRSQSSRGFKPSSQQQKALHLKLNDDTRHQVLGAKQNVATPTSFDLAWNHNDDVTKNPSTTWTVEAVLADPEGLNAFRNFLTKEFALENLLFYQDVQKLSSLLMSSQDNAGENNSDIKKSLVLNARHIVTQYIHLDGPLTVNIPMKLVTPLLSMFPKLAAERVYSDPFGNEGSNPLEIHHLEDVEANLNIDFEVFMAKLQDALKHVMNLMRVDSFNRFIRSKEFKAWEMQCDSMTVI